MQCSSVTHIIAARHAHVNATPNKHDAGTVTQRLGPELDKRGKSLFQRRFLMRQARVSKVSDKTEKCFPKPRDKSWQSFSPNPRDCFHEAHTLHKKSLQEYPGAASRNYNQQPGCFPALDRYEAYPDQSTVTALVPTPRKRDPDESLVTGQGCAKFSA